MKHKIQMLFWVLCIVLHHDVWTATPAGAPTGIVDIDDDNDEEVLPEHQIFSGTSARFDSYGSYEARVFTIESVRKALQDLAALQKRFSQASDDDVCSSSFVQETMQKSQQALQIVYDEYIQQKISLDVTISSLFKKLFLAQCGMYVRSVRSAVHVVQTNIHAQDMGAEKIESLLILVDLIVQHVESLEMLYFPNQNELISQEVNQVIGLPVLGNIVLPVFAEYVHHIFQLSDAQLYVHKKTLSVWMSIVQWFVQENGTSLYAAQQYQKITQQAIPLLDLCIDRIVQYETVQSKKNIQEYTALFVSAVDLYKQILPLCTGLLDAQYYTTAAQVQESIQLIQNEIMPVIAKQVQIDTEIVQLRTYFVQNFSPQTVQAVIIDLKGLITQYAALQEVLQKYTMSALVAFVQEESLLLSGDFCLALALYYWHLFLQDTKDGFVCIHSMIQMPDKKLDLARIVQMCDAAQDVLTQDTHRYAIPSLYEEHDIETLLVYAYAFYVQAGKQDVSVFERSSQALVPLEMMHAFKEVGQEWKTYFTVLELAVIAVRDAQKDVSIFATSLSDIIQVTDRLKQAFGKDIEYIKQWFGMKDIQFDQWAVQLITQVCLEKDFTGKEAVLFEYVEVLEQYAGSITDTQRRLLQRKSMHLERYVSQKKSVEKTVQKVTKELSTHSVHVQSAGDKKEKVTVHSSDQKAPAGASASAESTTNSTQNSGDTLYQQAEDASHQGKFYDAAKLYKQAVDEYTKLMHSEKDATKLAAIQHQLSLAQTREYALVPIANIVAFTPVFVAGMHVPSMYAELYSQITVSGDDVKMIPDSVMKNGVTKDTAKDFTDFLRKYCVYTQMKNKKIALYSVYKPNSLEHVSNISDDLLATVNAIEEAVDTYTEDVQNVLTAGFITANSTTNIPVEVTIKKSDKQVEIHGKNFPVALFAPLYPNGNAVATAFVSAIQLLQPGTQKIQINGQSFIPGDDPVLLQMLPRLLLHVYVYGAYEQQLQAQKMYAGIKDQLSKMTDVTPLLDQFTVWTDQYVQIFALLEGPTDSAQYYAQQVDAADSPKISNVSLVQKYKDAVFAEYISLAKTWLVGDVQSAGYELMLLKINTMFDAISGDQDASQAAQRSMALVYESAAQNILDTVKVQKDDQIIIQLYKSAVTSLMNAASMYTAIKDDVNQKRVMQLMYQCYLLQAGKLLVQYVDAHQNGISYTDITGKQQTSTWQNMLVLSQITMLPGIAGIASASGNNAELGKIHDQYKNILLQAALHIEAALSYYQAFMQDVSASAYDSLAQQVRSALVKNKIDIDETVAIDASQETVREEMLRSVSQALPLFTGNDQLMTVWIGSVYSCVAYAYLQDFLGGMTVPMDQDAFMKKWQDFVSAQQSFVQNAQNSSAAYVG
ncbi:hypothetical protein EBQ93_03405 [bacterium]|nr:hypothetical protein [bacterium]